MLNNFRGMFYTRLGYGRDSGNHESPSKQMWNIIAIIAILLNEAMQEAVRNGLLNNMMIYLMSEYHVTSAKAANIVSIWKAATVIMAFVWGFVSDSHLGRFSTISIASCSSLLGILFLWITAMIPEGEWVHCKPLIQSCRAPTAAEMTLRVTELTLLFASFPLISIGVGISCSAGFGADQILATGNSEPQKMRILERFFLFYYAVSFLAVIIASTVTVQMLDIYGWKMGFGVSTLSVFIFVILFFVCSPLYTKVKPKKGLSTGIAQVFVATFRNRNLPFPDPNNASGCYFSGEDSNMIVPSDNLRFLNKACLVINPEEDVAPDGTAVNPWRLCTIVQVEELKALLRVLPMWSTGIVMWMNTSQLTFKLLQARSMERHVSHKLEISKAAFPIAGVSTMLICGILYDRAILPLASKIKGEPVKLSVEIRMGIGLFLSWLATITSAIIESLRQRKANQKEKMSAMWLLPQYCLHGLAQGSTAAAQTEFLYTELPKTMTSVAVTLLVQGRTVGNWLSGLVLQVVSALSKRGGKGMISNDITEAPLNYFYWVSAAISLLNLFYFLICYREYGPCVSKSEQNEAEPAET